MDHFLQMHQIGAWFHLILLRFYNFARSSSSSTAVAPTSVAVHGAPGERRCGLRRPRCRSCSRGLASGARRASRQAGERALAAHLDRPRLQHRRVGDGHCAGLGLQGEDGAQGLKRPLLGNGECKFGYDVFADEICVG